MDQRASHGGAGTWTNPRLFHDVEVDFHDQENYLFVYLSNIGALGMFVRTPSPRAPGTGVHLRFCSGKFPPALELAGEVIWINPYRPADRNHLAPGMGIRFLELTGEQRAHVVYLVKRVALLPEDIS